MMLASMLLLALLTAPAGAASPKPSPKPSPEASAAPARAGQLTNVRIEFKLTDRRGTAEPATKLVSMIVADRRSGMIRAADGAGSQAGEFSPFALNVDASPVIEDGGRIRLQLSLEYKVQDDSAVAKGNPLRALRQNMNVVAESGRPLMVADSADPIGDRRVQVEVTATILR